MQSNNNDDNYDDNNNNKDVVIASVSKNSDYHYIVFFVPVAVAVAEAAKDVIHPCRCLLTSMLLHRRRGGDPLSSKPQSTDDNKDNDALMTSTSKNDNDHLRSLSGLRMMVEFPAQPEAVAC
jgi:hypothetical protein